MQQRQQPLMYIVRCWGKLVYWFSSPGAQIAGYENKKMPANIQFARIRKFRYTFR